MSDIEILGFPVSPHVRAARIAFAEKGLNITFREIGLDHLATGEFAAINPFRKMPALLHGDVVLFETPSLLVYADLLGSGPALEPDGALARARTWQFVGVVQNHIYPTGVMQLYFHRVLAGLFGMEPDEAAAAGAVAPTGIALDALENALDGGFLAGGAFGLADIYCGTMVDYVARTRDGRALVAERPGVARWLDALRSRPSFVQTLAPMLVGSDQA